MAVTSLNVLILPEDKEEELSADWRRTAGHFQRTDGFLEFHFFKNNSRRNTGVGNGTFKGNIAKPPEYGIPGVKGHPAIFESVCDLCHEPA